MTRLLRSVLFVPGTRQDRFPSAIAAKPDAVVFDLEDSVDPSRKREAREAIAWFIEATPDAAPLLLVRINPFTSEWFHDDLQFVSGLFGIGGAVLPKTESPAEVRLVAEALGSERVFPLVETPRGVLNASALADAVPSIPALLFGAEDLTAAIGVPRTVDGDELIFARSQVVLAAASVGAEAIDAVFTDLADAERLRRDAARARALGFRGKMAIHPSQIAAINEVFTPSAAELDRARRIVAAYEAAQTAGEAVLRLDNEMIDAPVVTRARRLLRLAEKQ